MDSPKNLSDHLPLPQSSIDVYESLLEDEKLVKWAQRYTIFYVTRFVTRLIILFIAVIVASLSNMNIISPFLALTVSIFVIPVMIIGLHNIYYFIIFVRNYRKYINSKFPSKNILLAVYLYQRTKKYYLEDGDPFFIPFRGVTIGTNSHIGNFLLSDPYDKEQAFEQNVGDLLYNEAIYYQRSQGNINPDFVNPQIINEIQSKDVCSIAHEMNNSYINGNKKTALILSRHVIEVYLHAIFSTDDEFPEYESITRKTGYGNIHEKMEEENPPKSRNGGKPTCGKLIKILEKRIEDDYITDIPDLDGENKNDDNEALHERLEKIKRKADSAIHGRQSYGEIVGSDEEFKNEFEDNLSLLIKLDKRVRRRKNGRNETAMADGMGYMFDAGS